MPKDDLAGLVLDDGDAKRNIQRSAELRVLISKSEINFDLRTATDKEFYTTTLYDIAFEHHRAMGTLLMLGMTSSALALMRPFIETSYRCIWLLDCASDKAVNKILKGERRTFPDISVIMRELERKMETDAFSVQVPRLEVLHDLTHSGVLHIYGRWVRLGYLKSSNRALQHDAYFCVYHADYVLTLLAMCTYGHYGHMDDLATIRREYVRISGSYEFPKPVEHSGTHSLQIQEVEGAGEGLAG